MGWVKLNTDGARDKDGKVSCGGFIKVTEGEWLRGFSKNIGISNVYIAELFGVLKGLKIIVTMNLRNIIMEVDSQ